MSVKRDLFYATAKVEVGFFKLLGHAMIYTGWLCFVLPFQIALWIFDLLVWILAMRRTREFCLPVFSPLLLLSRGQLAHRSRRGTITRQAAQQTRARAQQREQADIKTFLTDFDLKVQAFNARTRAQTAAKKAAKV